MKDYLKTFIGAISAGIAIAIGGLAFLITSAPWVFTIGLLMVCYLGLSLFTGKISYISSFKEFPKLMLIWVGNIIGAFILGIIAYHIRPDIIERARELTAAKLNEGWLLLPKAILCNVMIFAAVHGWKNLPTPLDGVAVIFATAIFVICGFEHCIANVFYFSASGQFSVPMIQYIIVNTLFNMLGGILAYRVTKYIQGD